MAVRKNLRHPDIVRQRIQTSQLINRLNNHVHGKCEMSQTQIRAAEILLKKALPDLQSTELTGPGGSELAVTVRKFSDD